MNTLIKKIMIGLILIFITCSITVLAVPLEPPTVDGDTQIVTIQGDFGPENANKKVTIQVMQANKNFDDLDNATPDNLFSYVNQVEQVYTDSQGKYLYQYKIKGGTGWYNVKVGSIHKGETYTAMFKYFSPEDIKVVLEQLESLRGSVTLSTQEKAAEIKNILSQTMNREQLTIEFPLYGGLTFDTLDESVFVALAESNTKYDTVNAFKSEYKAAVAVNAVNAIQDPNKVKDILLECDEVLNITRLNSYILYTAFDSDSKNAVNNMIVADNFSSTSSIVNRFNEAVFMRAIYKLQNWSGLKSLITDNNQYFEITFDQYNTLRDPSQVDKELAGKLYSGFQAFRNAFNDAVNRQKDVENKQSRDVGSPKGGKTSTVVKTGESSPVFVPVPSPSPSPVPSFTDLNDVSWAQEAIHVLADKGIVHGKEANKFFPLDNVKREEFIKMLVSGLGLLDEEADCSFKDTKENEWYYKYIATAQKLGIVKGLPDGTFGIGRNISRQEMVVIIYRAATLTGIEFMDVQEEKKFADMSDIDDYAVDAVVKMQKSNIINGTGEGLFAPKEYATRAQAAKVIFDLLKIANKF